MATVNVSALWHDLECGGYREDLPAWRALAAATGGPVLDIGAGTGRVTLDLAAQGVDVVALDRDAALLAALEHRAGGLTVETVHADARDFEFARRFSLILVPMQTLQLLDGRQGREAFLRCASAHLHPGGIVAAALADAMDCFDDEHSVPPPPDVRDVGDVRYSSQLLAVVDEGGRAALFRRRVITDASGRRHAEEVVLHLDRVSAEQVAAEASPLGFMGEDARRVPETEQYLGSTIVILRKPQQ
jgi:SAM-dependent methyltransferase